MKKFFLAIIFLIFVSVIVCAEYNQTTGVNKVTIYKGWNLTSINSTSTEDNTCASNAFQAAYYYSPVEGKYYGAIKNNTNSDYYTKKSEEVSKQYYHVIGGSQWIYSNQYCTFKTNIGVPSNSNTIQFPWTIKKGWNFIMIQPFMVGKKLKDLFSDCAVEKLNSWDAYTQNWHYEKSMDGTLYLNRQDSPVYEAGVGTTLVLKVSADCKLKLDQTVNTPPTLPE